jgi:hypothetical protein
MDINIHTIKEKNISRIEKKKPEYFFVCMGEPILFVYSSKVKESNHHTFCMWIDYAHKKKKKKKIGCHLPYLPLTRCHTVVIIVDCYFMLA